MYKFNPLTGTLDLVNSVDETILKSEHIGVTIQSYSTDTVVDPDYEAIKLLAQSALQPEDTSMTMYWSSTSW